MGNGLASKVHTDKLGLVRVITPRYVYDGKGDPEAIESYQLIDTDTSIQDALLKYYNSGGRSEQERLARVKRKRIRRGVE